MYQTWLVDNKLNILTVIMELFSKITDPYRIIKFMVIKKL
jgi:hypothetical protein